ncbi:MAG: DUF4389 domain-containing protein [Patescibacteria group bacterium]
MDSKKTSASEAKCCEECSVYPCLKAERIQNPNRLWAFPFFGFFVKVLILIPVFLELAFLNLILWFASLINSFFVLFQGKYWDEAYKLNLGLMRLSIKLTFFLSGLTDRYPGFSFEINDNFSVEIEKPKNPNRGFAVPFFGGLARFVLLIPFMIWIEVLRNIWIIVMVVSSIPVLFSSKYPQSTFELIRDYTRITLAATAYMTGLSDKYPSFSISMENKNIKIAFIIMGILFFLLTFLPNLNSSSN